MVVRCGGTKKCYYDCHTKFCKFVLKVSKFMHNMMMYEELGRYPLHSKLLDHNTKKSR